MEWISVSSLYNAIHGEPLLDWLEIYGPAAGLFPDREHPDYLEQADFGKFVQRKGSEFESRLMSLIRGKIDVVDVDYARRNEDFAYENTRCLVSDGREAIYQGLVRDYDLRVFGVPDLIIRGDALIRLVPSCAEHVDPETYTIVDIKYKGLKLNQKGDLNASHLWDKVQLTLYARGLAALVGYEIPKAYLLGRGDRGSSCFERLGWTRTNVEETAEKIQAAISWRRDFDAFGMVWGLDDPLGDERLAPNPKNDRGGGFSRAKSMVAKRLAERRPPQRGPAIMPLHIEYEREHWHPKPALEFFVDFETANLMNDDFTALPVSVGCPMIFMIGCGHEEEGAFEFKSWTAEAETHEAERKIIEAWIEHMAQVRVRFGVEVGDPPIFHWTPAETRELHKAAVRHRHPEWEKLPWFDLSQVIEKEPVTVHGVRGYSLKPIAKAMRQLGMIETDWDESLLSDGLSAMTAAWWCYTQARRLRQHPSEIATESGRRLMEEIAAYNAVDCKAMWEILRYFRKYH